jgi:hypothetical protein
MEKPPEIVVAAASECKNRMALKKIETAPAHRSDRYQVVNPALPLPIA